MGEEPKSGHLFVFRNKAEDCVKVLYWDKDGYAIWYKRVERGKFSLPSGSGGGLEIDFTEFSMLLSGIDMKKVKRRKRYEMAPTG
jgi:transposase